MKERKEDIKRFVALVRQYAEIGKLTYENVHEFIDRIVIHELDKETKTRKIEIFYSFVGKVEGNGMEHLLIKLHISEKSVLMFKAL